MKNLLLFSIFILSTLGVNAQVEPKVTITTTTFIAGSAQESSIVHIDANNDGTSDYNITIPATGVFNQVFGAALTAGTYVVVWAEDANTHHTTTRIAYTVQTAAQAIQTLIDPNYAKADEKRATENLRAKNLSMANVTAVYKAQIWNTVFSVPIARVNMSRNEPFTEGHVSLFSSIGAGFGYSIGRWTVTRNNVGEITSEEFSNSFGIHVGAIYSSSTGDEATNIIAPTINVGLLDVQFGVGYEVGTITENQKRIFFTFSYDIPLYRLTKTNYRVRLRTPLPIDVK